MADLIVRRWTPAVERGIRYAIAALEFDARAPQPTLSDGTAVALTLDPDDLNAAATWLRYQREHRATNPDDRS